MKPFLPILLGLCATCLASCSSNAPPAPIGLDRRPANASETAAEPLAMGDRTPTTNVSPAAFVETGPLQACLQCEKRDKGRSVNNRRVEIHFNQVDHGQRT
jgi:hypothetical protein